jgi:peptidoglycan L-alanyl-D-glutamate endopeptidase CwlK
MAFSFGRASQEKLATVKIELQHVVRLALYLSPVDFGITEGIRTIERQKILVSQGKSQTLKSRHLIGEAIDICPYINGSFTYEDKEAFKQIAAAFDTAAAILGEKITWGGNWVSFVDMPHFQIEIK